MLRNYLLIAFRNLWHNKVYALINILGLAIGLTAALFIFQYVQFERSYDSFHENADNIYRLIARITMNGVQQPPEHFATSHTGPTLKREAPEVMKYARLFQNYKENFLSFHFMPGTALLLKNFWNEKFIMPKLLFFKCFLSL